MKRKMVSVLLALTMVLGLLPGVSFHAHAEGTNEASVTIDGVTTEYATLEEALTQVYGKTATIELLQEVTVESPIALFSGEDLLLCGNGHNITGAGLSVDQPVINIQNASLVLENITILNNSGNSTELVFVYPDSALTLQKYVSMISNDAEAIVNCGTLTIHDGSVGSFSQNAPAIRSENAVVRLDAPEGNVINLVANIAVSVEVLSGSLTMAGNLNVKGIRAVNSFSDPQVAALSLSGPLTGNSITVDFDAFVQPNPGDFAMVGPAGDYTITQSDVEKIMPMDIDFSSFLGDDGCIWAKYTHTHAAQNGQYMGLGNGQHTYDCSCGETITEDCEYVPCGNNTEHWYECAHCWQIDDATIEPHVPQDNCLCACGMYFHQSESWTLDPNDENRHTGTCLICHETVSAEHDLTWGHDDAEHWTACTLDCGYKTAVQPHEWYEWLPSTGNYHYHDCGCGMTQVEPHTDDDSDSLCDICRAPMCVDTNGDHICDDCHYTIDELCSDANGDHICDTQLCSERQEEWCSDADLDHICDTEACSAYLSELCEDNNDDWLCDICGTDLCSHRFSDLVINDDDTHTGLCIYCGREITEACDDTYGVWWDDMRHQRYCSCGRIYDEEPHSFTVVSSITLTSHVLGCSGCGETILEAHRFVDGVCEGCRTLESEKTYDVYVGGIGLENGQYVDPDGNVSDTRPEGGYAHYANGVLTLHNYHCSGHGFIWKVNAELQFGALIYATVDLVLELSGENSLTNNPDVAKLEGDGIAAELDLTIRGQGSLTVSADNDGIYTRNGDLIMEDGVVSLGILEYDEHGDIAVNDEIGDAGLDVDGDVIIKGGKLTINADDHGMDVKGDVIIRGGVVDVTADDDGLDVEEDIIILGGDVTVDAYDYGLDSEDGSVTISGGHVDIYTENSTGIYANAKADISGGEIYIDSGENGIYAYQLSISGGYLNIYDYGFAIYCGELTLGVELPEDAYVDDSSGEVLVDADDNLVIEGREDAAPSTAYANGMILLENIPQGLTVIIAGYDDGQMTELQVLTNVTGDIKPGAKLLACDEVKTFFLGGDSEPLVRALVLE